MTCSSEILAYVNKVEGLDGGGVGVRAGGGVLDISKQ